MANRFSEVNQNELGLVDGVVIQKPEMVEETKEPIEFFQGMYTIIIIFKLTKNIKIMTFLYFFSSF